jgi:lactonase family protein with 7-bladed beta-propeller
LARAGRFFFASSGDRSLLAAGADADWTPYVDSEGKKISAGGENTIAMLTIDQTSGEPRPAQAIDTHGFHPRTFSIDPTGRVLVAANLIEPAGATKAKLCERSRRRCRPTRSATIAVSRSSDPTTSRERVCRSSGTDFRDCRRSWGHGHGDFASTAPVDSARMSEIPNGGDRGRGVGQIPPVAAMGVAVASLQPVGTSSRGAALATRGALAASAPEPRRHPCPVSNGIAAIAAAWDTSGTVKQQNGEQSG